MERTTKIGTRGSALALAQTTQLVEALRGADPARAELFAITVIRTTGDRIRDRALAEAGGKGLFTKELDEALLDGRIDMAMHSAKDLPTILPDGLVIAGYLPREDVRDVLVAPAYGNLAALPRGASVGTAAVRREAQLKRLRPDLQVRLMRGNVDTRLRKIAEGEYDAALLAFAGLKRLNLADRATEILAPEVFLPAAGQGAIAVVIRRDDAAAASSLEPVLDAATSVALRTERAFLAALDGSCRTPIAGYAVIDATSVWFRGLALRLDGTDAVEVERRGTLADAEALGGDAAAELLLRLPPGILEPRA